MTNHDALSPLDGRYTAKTSPLTEFFSETALNRYRLKVETEWLICLCATIGEQPFSKLTDTQAESLRKIARNFDSAGQSELAEIEKKTNHDVKAVEYFLRSRLPALDLESASEAVHFALTSEDVNNLSYAMMIRDAAEKVLHPDLDKVIARILVFAENSKNHGMISRTHGQTATPTTLGKEFKNFHARLERQRKKLSEQEFLGKLNGAVGNFNAHCVAFPDIDWPEVSASFIRGLGLIENPFTTQIEPHDWMIEYFHAWSRANTILIDLCRDVWGYVSLDYIRQRPVESQTGSSTMPHKVNPIDFENAEGNLGMANAFYTHFAEKLPISRWQRDLSDSTVLRNIGSAFGHQLIALSSILKGESKIHPNAERMADELNDKWEVLSEAVQTQMRALGKPDAYEKLKEFSRGKSITKEMLHDFIRQAGFPPEIESRLLTLTPAKYLGRSQKF